MFIDVECGSHMHEHAGKMHTCQRGIFGLTGRAYCKLIDCKGVQYGIPLTTWGNDGDKMDARLPRGFIRGSS